ncbi:MAG: DUF1292 domain-containing protein [Firmicutes bacterium]|nr:DUF1292 domain-containing protein [Bacillota bacterium]
MSEDEFFDEYDTIMLTDEEGTEKEFAVIDALELDGNSYILVVEADVEDDEESMAMILKKTSEDNDDVSYELVEDDDEFDKVAEIFQKNGDDYEVKIED